MKKTHLIAAGTVLSLVLAGQTAGAESQYNLSAIILQHAQIDGEVFAERDVNATYTANVVLPDEDTAVDHWEIDGVATEECGESFTFSGADGSMIAAILRPRDVVKGINCHFQFFEGDRSPVGESFTEFDFEEAYTIPATGENHEGGTICVNVTADIPSGYEVDYWLINDVKYDFDADVTAFGVHDLDEYTVYEVVFKAKETYKVKETEPIVTKKETEGTPETEETPETPPQTEENDEEYDHRHSFNPVRSSEPWCEDPGMQYFECDECGLVWGEESSPPLGHDMQEVYGDDGTCILLRCSRCGMEVG